MIVLHRRHLYVAGLCLCFLVAMGAVLRHGGAAYTAAFAASAGGERPIVVVDAGHGGEDGGAVAADGTVESGLNLDIALRAADLLTFTGVRTVLTRSDDSAIYDEGSATLREKKVSDLKNRVALVNATENAVLLSIHQNSLPSSPSTHGAQVFYNSADGAESMAGSVQAALNQAVNTEKAKSPAAIGSSVYLMKNITVPGVLVECGFLTNQAEAALLQTPAHQLRLAAAMTAGLLNTGEDTGGGA